MNKINQVVVSLKGELENGDVFEQTPEDHPIIIILDGKNIFHKLEEALKKMKPEETRTITLSPEEAYGPHHKELVQTLDMPPLDNKIQPEPGMILSLNVERNGQQEKVPATVIEVKDGKMTVDYNHPMAGKTVIYTLTLHDIRV